MFDYAKLQNSRLKIFTAHMGKLGGMGKLWAMGRNINLMSCVFTSHMDFNLDLDLDCRGI